MRARYCPRSTTDPSQLLVRISYRQAFTHLILLSNEMNVIIVVYETEMIQPGHTSTGMHLQKIGIPSNFRREGHPYIPHSSSVSPVKKIDALLPTKVTQQQRRQDS